jgi:hypothetical protein
VTRASFQQSDKRLGGNLHAGQDIILAAIRASQPIEWDALFAAIRDELNDIETIAAQMKAEG